MLKKFFLLAPSFLMTTLFVPADYVSCEEILNIKQAPVSPAYMDYLENPYKYKSAPSIIDMSLNAPVKIEAELPESYSLCSDGLVSSIKNQGAYGTCWAFSAVSSMETSLIKNNPLIDISEWHLAYFCTVPPANTNDENTDFYSLFEAGGGDNQITNKIAYWQGIVDEEKIPYMDKTVVNEEYRYMTDYHVSSVYTSFMDWDNYENSVNAVKEYIYNGNCVGASFSSYYEFLNLENSAYCGYYDENLEDDALNNFHAVSVVGWDDNYPKENFNFQPENDGAWLIKNSWGENEGENGYYWISYEDYYFYFDSAYTLDYAENYDNIYYNGDFYEENEEVPLTYHSVGGTLGYTANIFTSKRNEYISGAGFYTSDNGSDYEVNIYTDIKDKTNPASGDLKLVVSGTAKYAGYHTIDFYEGIYIEEGTDYSIVVKVQNPENEYAVLLYNSYVPENSSFISSDGVSWIDTSSYPYVSENASIGTATCKVFTNNADKIEFSEYSPYIYSNQKIRLTSDSNRDIYYSLDNEHWNIYTEPITVNDTVTVYASFSSDGSNCIAHTYSPMKAVIENLSYTYNNESFYMDIYEENGVITQAVPSDVYELSLFADISPNSKIKVNNEEVNAGKPFTANLENNVTVLEIEVFGENQISTMYTVKLIKSYINNVNETIHFDETKFNVTAQDGTKIYSNDYIGNYSGQILTAEYTDGSGNFEIYVPERAQTYPLEIEKYNLDNFSVKYYENMQYSLTEYDYPELLEFYDDVEFYGIVPDTYYNMYQRHKATDELFCSYIDEYMINISSEENKINVYSYGEISGDNMITSDDALLVLEYTVGLHEFDEEISHFADVDLSSEINSQDALTILEYVVSSIESLPVFSYE